MRIVANRESYKRIVKSHLQLVTPLTVNRTVTPKRPPNATCVAFKAHAHMLRHACGYVLANKGHDTRALQAYLGHRNIQHTVRYTELSAKQFRNLWDD